MSNRDYKSKLLIEENGEKREYVNAGRVVTFVPLTIKKKHTSKVLVPPAGVRREGSKTSIDYAILKTLGKAFYWQKLIDEGEYDSGNALAKELKLEPGWVAEVLRMTRLAPEIVESILNGSQPVTLNLHQIRGRDCEIPVIWSDQKEQLGYA
jgi:hypothetical protein